MAANFNELALFGAFKPNNLAERIFFQILDFDNNLTIVAQSIDKFLFIVTDMFLFMLYINTNNKMKYICSDITRHGKITCMLKTR